MITNIVMLIKKREFPHTNYGVNTNITSLSQQFSGFNGKSKIEEARDVALLLCSCAFCRLSAVLGFAPILFHLQLL